MVRAPSPPHGVLLVAYSKPTAWGLFEVALGVVDMTRFVRTDRGTLLGC